MGFLATGLTISDHPILPQARDPKGSSIRVYIQFEKVRVQALRDRFS